ncbi:hypothetical protein ABPG74_000886 [Tetrahymena malaccensis]
MQADNIDEAFLDAPICDEMRSLLEIPQDLTTLTGYINNNKQQKLYPKCLPIIWKSIKESVKALKKYYKADRHNQEDQQKAQSTYKQEIEQIKEQLILALPQAKTIIITLGVSFCIGAGLLASLGVLAAVGGGVLGILLGALALFSLTKKNNESNIESRSYILKKAERVLGLDNLEYTQDDLEDIFKTERNVYHPDKFQKLTQKKAFIKRFLELVESYEIIKQLKNWQ